MFARAHTHSHHAWDTPRVDTFVDLCLPSSLPLSLGEEKSMEGLIA